MHTDVQRRGLMLVLSSPSGAGKSTIAKTMLASHDDLTMSVSATTRPMRSGEVDGEDYLFIDCDQFDEMVDAGEFLECATVFENLYGTPRGPVEAALKAGRDVLFDVDWQGNQKLRENGIDDLVSIFILPPSIDELERRLHSRAQDSEEVVAKRMLEATSEMSHWAEFDYIIINHDRQESVSQVETILAAERLKRRRQTGLNDFLRTMDVGQ